MKYPQLVTQIITTYSSHIFIVFIGIDATDGQMHGGWMDLVTVSKKWREKLQEEKKRYCSNGIEEWE